MIEESSPLAGKKGVMVPQEMRHSSKRCFMVVCVGFGIKKCSKPAPRIFYRFPVIIRETFKNGVYSHRRMVDNTLASKLADAGHFAAREAETAEQNAKSFGHSADAKNAVFFRTLAITYFAVSEAMFAGVPVQPALARLNLPREFDGEMSQVYQKVVSQVIRPETLSAVPLSVLVPTVYKSH